MITTILKLVLKNMVCETNNNISEMLLEIIAYPGGLHKTV